MLKKSRRKVGEIPTSSMADIAFLLLIFFMVTTTISSDKGLLFFLPEWSDEPPKQMKLQGVVNILLNANDEVMISYTGQEPSVVPVNLIKDRLITLARQIGQEKIIVSVKCDKESTYEKYVDIIDQIQSAKIKRVSLAQE